MQKKGIDSKAQSVRKVIGKAKPVTGKKGAKDVPAKKKTVARKSVAKSATTKKAVKKINSK